MPARNDHPINNYPKNLWVKLYRENIDKQAVKIERRFMQYFTKYLTKKEPLSDTLKHITEELMRRQQTNQGRSHGMQHSYMKQLTSVLFLSCAPLVKY